MDKNENNKKANQASLKDILKTAYELALQCYGIVGFARADAVVSGKYDQLTDDKVQKGIEVKKTTDGRFDVDLCVVLSHEVKLTETIYEAQKTIRYGLNKKYSNQIRKVNIYVISIK